MKKNVGKVAIGTLAMVALIVLALSIGLNAGDGPNQPSSKVTARYGVDDINVIDLLICEDEAKDPPAAEWVPVLRNSIKTPNQKDLFIDVSMVSTLLTDTRAKSKRDEGTGEPEVDTTTATSGIKVRVVIGTDVNENGKLDLPSELEMYAEPGEEGVVFAKRIQKLSVQLQGFLELDAEGNLVIDEEYEEFVELMLKTMSANAFNFIADDLTAGVHMVEMQVSRVLDAGCDGTYAEVEAIIGHRSMTVESVRLIKDEDLLEPPVVD